MDDITVAGGKGELFLPLLKKELFLPLLS